MKINVAAKQVTIDKYTFGEGDTIHLTENPKLFGLVSNIDADGFTLTQAQGYTFRMRREMTIYPPTDGVVIKAGQPFWSVVRLWGDNCVIYTDVPCLFANLPAAIEAGETYSVYGDICAIYSNHFPDYHKSEAQVLFLLGAPFLRSIS